MLLVAGELVSGRLLSYDTSVAPTTEEVVVSVALVAPLAFGPRAPVAVFATVMATCLVQLVVTEHVLVADLAPLVALYYLVVHGPGRLKPIGLGVAATTAGSWRRGAERRHVVPRDYMGSRPQADACAVWRA